MRRLMISLSLILIVMFSGCGEQGITIVSDIKDGVVIKDFSFDSSTVYAGDIVGLNLEVQNVGEYVGTILDITLFGPAWVSGVSPSPDIINEQLSPSEPEVEFEGESRSTRWRLQTPFDIKTETPYSIGVRVTYQYETNYEGILRVVEEDYLETLPQEERESLLESGGVISSSSTGGPLTVNPVKGRNFVIDGVGGTQRPIKFEVTNVGSGYPVNFEVTIPQGNLRNLNNCGIQEDSILRTTIKLSKGESRIFTCWFLVPSNIVNKEDVIFRINFDYNYYVDDVVPITVEPSGIEGTIPPPPPPPVTTTSTLPINACGSSCQDDEEAICCCWSDRRLEMFWRPSRCLDELYRPTDCEAGPVISCNDYCINRGYDQGIIRDPDDACCCSNT